MQNAKALNGTNYKCKNSPFLSNCFGLGFRFYWMSLNKLQCKIFWKVTSLVDWRLERYTIFTSAGPFSKDVSTNKGCHKIVPHRAPYREAWLQREKLFWWKYCMCDRLCGATHTPSKSARSVMWRDWVASSPARSRWSISKKYYLQQIWWHLYLRVLLSNREIWQKIALFQKGGVGVRVLYLPFNVDPRAFLLRSAAAITTWSEASTLNVDFQSTRAQSSSNMRFELEINLMSHFDDGLKG